MTEPADTSPGAASGPEPDAAHGLGPSLRIGVVGPCAAGKSSLVQALKARGWQAKPIAQEHSYVKDMWLRLTHPDLLIYLDVSYPNSLVRRNMNWTLAEYEEQVRRLQHARQQADIYIDTNQLDQDGVLAVVLNHLSSLE